MKRVVVIHFLLVVSFFSAQTSVDFKDIGEKVKDSASAYYYKKLVYKFVHLPQSLDSIESKYLYYGQFSAPDYDDKKVVVVGDFTEFFNRKKYKEGIEEGEKILKQELVNLEVLGKLVLLYDQGDKENKMFPVRRAQFKALLDAVIKNPIQKDENKVYVVMSIADEYLVANFLGYNLYTMRRRSDHVSDGIIDNWKLLKKRISFLVHYKRD